jgi:hypothetical protein
MKNYSYLPAVKVVLESFVDNNIWEFEDYGITFESMFMVAENNIEMGEMIDESTEVLEMLEYIAAKGLVNTFFRA